MEGIMKGMCDGDEREARGKHNSIVLGAWKLDKR